MIKTDPRVAIVTGAAQGQGAAEARRLVKDGFVVILGDLLDDLGEQTALSLGAAAHFVHLDVTEPADWKAAVSRAGELGSISGLVNNAALSWLRAFEDETSETMEKMWRVNLLGPFMGIQAVLPEMRAAGAGSIVNISSVAGTQGIAYNSAYAASKWALRGLTKSCAVEFGEYGVRVNIVHPGPINSGLLPVAAPGVTNAERYKHLPLGRVGEADEVASLVSFLLGDESSYITGADFAIDGGSTAGPGKPAVRPYAVIR